MSDCARCREPLQGDGRWNVTFGGWSHQACRGRAVWPPLCSVQRFEYNPLIALRKMATKPAFAGHDAQAHIQALMEIVGRDFDIPRPRQRHDSLSSVHDRGQVTSSSLQSSTAPLALVTPRSGDTTPTAERKRRQPPPPTPKHTPSPPPKNARSSEADTTAQASKNQPPTTSKKTSTPPLTRKEAKPVEKEPKREYDLQTAVKSAGGEFVVLDVNNVHNQYRQIFNGQEFQFTDSPECKECDLCLEAWAGYPKEKTKCSRCKSGKKRGKALDTSICTWRCRHDIEVCSRCIPVVLRTPICFDVEIER